VIVADFDPAEVGLWLTVTRLQVSPEASAVFGMHAFELGEENLNWLVEPDVVYVVEPSRIGPLFALSVTVPQDLVSPMPVLPHESEETIAVPAAAPVPESETLVFVPLAALVVRVTVRVPVPPAVNVIVPRLQELPEERVAPAQVPAATVKSSGCEPLFVTGVALSTTAPPVAVIVAVPEQFEAIPTVPEQLTPLTLSVAVPYEAEPDRVAEPAVPLEGVTVIVADRVPPPPAVKVTGPSLHEAPSASVWFAVHALLTLAATEKSLACEPLSEKSVEPRTTLPFVAVTVISPVQVDATPTLPVQLSADVETVTVPYTPEPVIVFEPAAPTEGETFTVSVWAPAAVGLNALTVIRLQLWPLASTDPAVHTPVVAAAYVNAVVAPETV